MNKIYIKKNLIAVLVSVSFTSFSQVISTFAGDSAMGFFGDGGPATNAELAGPAGVIIDAAGNIYIPDVGNYRVRKVNSSGIITTFAGTGTAGYSGDGGPATNAQLSDIGLITLDATVNIYITDLGNNRIRIVNTSGIIRTYAGDSAQGFSGDGGPATAAELNLPNGVASDSLGNIYISDTYNYRIRKVSPSGIINTIAGNGISGYSGDGGPATDAELDLPVGIVIDSSGKIYIADYFNNRVRIVNQTGIINTIAGNGAVGFYGDGGPATAAEFFYPVSVELDVYGNLYIADQRNNRIRIVTTSGIINTIAGNGVGGFSGDGGTATDAELKGTDDARPDASGNIYIADNANSRIRKISSVTTTTSNSLPLSSKVTVYPLPTTGSFTISGISQGQLIELYNYSGEKVLSAIGYQPIANFAISNQPNGIYLIRILNKDGSVFATKKVVKTE